VVTCIDGYQMARRGRAGPALATAALSSFFAGCVSTLIVAMFAPPLAEVALKFGPAEYFSLMVLGLVSAVVLASGSLIKAIAMVILGLLLGLVGTDVNSGVLRFAFGISELADGIGFVTVAMGMFGIAEIIANLEQKENREIFTSKVSHLFPNTTDWERIWGPTVRGTALGSALGILPGGGALLASFGAYTMEKKVSFNAHEFGKGAIEGVAAPESANNAGAQTSFIPLLTLGIPSNAVMALMIGAMMIQGIAPGPQVMTERKELFWGMIASMWVGNLMLVILNLPLIGMWIKLLTVPYRWLYPSILLFMLVGVFSISNQPFDCFLMALFGMLGYICVKLECEPAPLILGFILGPLMEENLRRAMLLSRGDWQVFISNDKPISQGFLIASAVLLAIIALPALRKKREEAFSEDGTAQAAAAGPADGSKPVETKADDDAGATRKWNVYQGADGNLVAVSEGFNLAAFFFSGLWALMKDLFLATMVWLVAFVVLTAVSFFWLGLDLKTFGWCMLGLSVPFGIVYGLKANRWLMDKYERHHYKLVRQVTAKNADIAIARGRRLAAAAT
jgi:TctA family transporter